MRKILLGAAATLAALLVLLVALPFLFRDRIVARVRTAVYGAVNARVTIGDVGLSVLRDFPNVTLRVAQPSLVGIAPFSGDTLVAMDEARVVLDLGSVVRHLTSGARIVVREVALERPRAYLRVLADGRANWDIAKPSADTSTSSRAVGITLRDLTISDGLVTLDDAQAKLDARIVGLDESLRGDFASERFVLSTRTVADSVSVRFAGVPYLSRARIELNADIDADTRAGRYAFDRDTLRLNELLLAFGGSVTTGSPDLTLDVQFAAPSTDFKHILSLVPAVYARDFASIRTGGTMSVSGRVQGRHGPTSFPAFSLRAQVRDGTFQYASLPLPARDIALDLNVENPGGHADSTVVSLTRLHAAIGGRPVDARLVVRTPVSDPHVDLRVVGAVDLADVARTVKLDSAQRMAGTVAADVAVRARLSDVDAKRYDNVNATGNVHVSRVTIQSTALPHPVALDTAALRLTPRAAELSTLVARLGASDVRATLSLDNLLGFALRGDELRGSGSIASQRFDLAALIPKERTSGVVPVPARVDFALQANLARVTLDSLVAEDVRGGLRVKDERVTLDGLRLRMLGGAVAASGFYETKVPDRPAFDTDLRLDTVDVATAFRTLNSVQRLAPVARWAQGRVSGRLRLAGPMDGDMAPVFTALGGEGQIGSERLALQGVPALGKLADALSIEAVRNPATGALRAAFTIANGRVNVTPFAVRLAGVEMSVGGSHGLDQTLAYDLGLAVPRTLLGDAANRAMARLASMAGRAGADTVRGEAIQLRGTVKGTVTAPQVDLNFAGVATSARAAVQQAVESRVAEGVAAARARADSAADAARERGRAEAQRLVAEAARQADTVKAEARRVADGIRTTAAARADSLEARATNPLAKVAAKRAADGIKREANSQADRLVRSADARADSLVARARARADSVGAAPARP